jgi:hypothetical protein
MFRNTKKKNAAILIASALLGIVVIGCKKTDKVYYNYHNSIGTYSGNTLQYLQSQTGVYDSMLLVINRLTGIEDTIRNGDITLFAVSNLSFTIALQNINQERRNALPALAPVSFGTMDSASLDTFFCRYIIRGKKTTDSIDGYTDGRLFQSVRYNYNMQMQLTRTNASGYLNGGPKSILFSDPRNSIFVSNWVRVNTITVDIKTSNGIVHLLPPGHDFGFGSDFINHINK